MSTGKRNGMKCVLWFFGVFAHTTNTNNDLFSVRHFASSHPKFRKIFCSTCCSVLQSLIKGSCKIKRAKKSCTTNLQQAIQSKSLTYTYHYLTLILIIDYLPRAFSTKISLLKRVFLQKRPPNSYFEHNFSIAEFCDLHFDVREICINSLFRP